MSKRKRLIIAPAILAALIATASCASAPARESWKARDASLPRGLSVELRDPAPGEEGDSSFRIRGDELAGAALRGEARRSGEDWVLSIQGMDWFDTWAEGWTEASFLAEGSLRLRPDGSSWLMEVEAAPKIEGTVSASIRLYGDYFEGDKALGLFTHRWDRIQAADEILKKEFPDAWFDYSEPRKIRNLWDFLFLKRVANFQSGLGPFLFPEVYAPPKGSPPRKKGPTVRAESIDWDTSYTDERFPDNLREIRNSGTMYRDFEEGAGLWRLDFCWDELWGRKIAAVAFIKGK